MSITAAAFDYGGVISLYQDKEAMKDMADIVGIDPFLFERIYWENRPILDQGLVEGIEFFKNILANVGVFADPDSLEKILCREALHGANEQYRLCFLLY